MKNNMINYRFFIRLRKSRLLKVISVGMVLNIITTMLPWNVSFALTSGPSQPEASSFQQISMTEMVDPFTGDFSYNIPLLEIGGYPINLSYASGIDMDQEASWVGLGWNVNTGAITRNLRGLPDDFWGDTIKREVNLKDNITVGVNAGLGVEFFGLETNDIGLGVNFGVDVGYNNYTGVIFGQSVAPAIGIGDAAKTSFNASLGLKASGGAIDIQPSVGLTTKSQKVTDQNKSTALNIGLNINSRVGLQNISLDASRKFSKSKVLDQNGKSATTRGGFRYFGANISFASPSYTPQIDIPMENLGLSFSLKTGVALWGADADLTVGAYYSKQSVAVNTIKTPAYGYLFSQKATGKSKVLHDFNREKDGGFTFETPNLPLTNYTYDVYNIQAQGIGGSFRPFRNNAGYVFDAQNTSYNGSGSGGIEFSGSNIVDFGGDININFASSSSGIWKNGNLAEEYLRFNDRKTNDIKEHVYFKMLGEKKADTDPSYYEKLKREKPLAFKLNSTDQLNNQFVDERKHISSFNQKIERQNREKRNTSIEQFSVQEVKRLYPHAAKYIPGWAPDHHIAMIIITTADGSRYVFGLPAYNLNQKEISFAVGTGVYNSGVAPTLNLSGANLVSYTNSDASVANNKGIDHRYDATILPAFVHTWYLTEVLSSDYVDVSGDGPSEDDLGNYTYFEYGTRSASGGIKPQVELYRWRTPLSNQAFWAQYNEGLKTDPSDDIANITYGEKQIWYLRTIESKTQIAVFGLSDRNDGFGVTGESGTIGGTAQKKLDHIKLYSKEEYTRGPANAIPIKAVYFNYSYNLCKGIPNNPPPNNTLMDMGGKLTLQEVYFTYEKSAKAKFSPYRFDYKIGTDNPNYNPRAVDKWGYYHPEGSVPNQEYPYTDQDQVQQDYNAAVWSLKSIILPSGGKINIDYESDDYGYVQNEEVGRMFKVVGASDTLNGPITNKLYTLSGNYEFLYFDLETSLVGSLSQDDADKQVLNTYFKNPAGSEKDPLKYLYFRFFTNISDAVQTLQNEYVSGYVEVEGNKAGARYNPVSGEYDKGWVKIKNVTINDNGGGLVNPISKAAWQFSRIHTPNYAFQQPTPQDDGFMTIIKILTGGDIFQQMLNFFNGPNGRMYSQGYGSEFVPNQSWIRLYDPDNRKLGGGHRVKKIIIDDNWSEETRGAESSFSYGQEYYYQNEDGTSSGVASWEPAMGADENIHRIPIFYEKKNILVPDERFYQEGPVGESFFPSPSVGYSRVKVQNLQYQDVINNATGYIIHEFYTAKDFPTITARTGIEIERFKIPGISFLLGIPTFDYVTVSQGFSIELNDMHGKPKATWIYEEGSPKPISGTEYLYHLDTEEKLSSKVDVLGRDGKLTAKEVGVDFDFVADFREYSTNSYGARVQINLASFLVSFFPALIPSLFPDISVEFTRFRSATTTKVINRSGILMETRAYDLGSMVATKNVAFDEYTGDVLVTQVNNEFDDDRYAVNVPAHWIYDRMGFASDNWGFEFESQPQTMSSAATSWDRTTGAVLAPATNYLVPGDEVTIPKISAKRGGDWGAFSLNAHMNRLWVSQDSTGSMYFIDHNGIPYKRPAYTDTVAFKIIRSGRRNMAAVNVGSAEMLESPFNGSGLLDIVQHKKILNASAQEFHELWKIHSNRQVEKSHKFLLVNEQATINIPWELTPAIRNGVLSGDFFPYCDITHLMGPEANFCQSSYNVTLGQTHTTGYHTAKAGNAKLTIVLSPNSGGPNCTMELVSMSASVTPANTYQIASITPGGVIPFGTADYYYFLSNILNNTDEFLVTVTLTNGEKYLFLAHLSSAGNCPSFTTDTTTFASSPYCDITINDTINPYIYGMLGNWRPKLSYTYLVNRNNDSTGVDVDLRQDGYYKSFQDFFWLKPSQPGGFWEKISSLHINPQAWKWITEITEYSPWGFELENKDALNNYSAALYGYKNTLPVMVAQNAMYREIASVNFEDYYIGTSSFHECGEFHLRFQPLANVTNEEAHTGWHSMRINGGNNAFSKIYAIRSVTEFNPVRREISKVPMVIRPNDLLGYFSPKKNEEDAFMMSFWVKKAGFNPYVFNYTAIVPEIIMGTNVLSPGDITKGPMIEGWQQFICKFHIPVNYTGDIEFSINNTSPTYAEHYFIDDIRIQPFRATAKTFVYDPRTLKFMAELDENNFATFYEYDEEGSLVRIKKETERGIMTIQENRSKSYKSNVSQ